MAVAFIICAAIGQLNLSFLQKEYVSEFKEKIIKPTVKFIDKQLDYDAKKYIDSWKFIESKIFTTKPDRCKGGDYVCGKIGSSNIEFSEFHAEYKTKDNKARTNWHTIFRGLFFISDFNKNFNGRTVVVPDTAEKLFGFIGTKLQTLNFSRDQFIKLEDPEFEKLFAVYGTDQIEARYILSSSLMKRIVDFKIKTKKEIYLSFVNSKIYVAIRYNKPLFEPKIFKQIYFFDVMWEYFEDLQTAIGLVEDLNLNTRIWSKS